MPLSRRRLLVTGSLAVAAGSAVPVLLHSSAEKEKAKGTEELKDWDAVRRQFDLAPGITNLALFYIASHPRPVREAIESYRRQLDGNPLQTVEHLMYSGDSVPAKTTAAIAAYIGGRPEEIALTQNTTTGLALIYHGLPLKAGHEILTTAHDHYAHHESIRLAAERAGATWRKIPLFDSHDAVSADEIVDRIRRGIRPETRAVGVTWVHSSTGLKLPIRAIADSLAQVNAGRSERDRVLLVVDGVHGIGVEDPQVAQMGCDAFATGTHKWLFGPRGTGFVWARTEVWATMRPLVPSFTSFDLNHAWMRGEAPNGPARASWFSPGGFWAFEHYWAVPAAFSFHQEIGPARVTERIHALNEQVKEGLAKIPKVTLYTPRSRALSSGIVCFDVEGLTQRQVVGGLREKKIVASTTPYAESYARIAFGLANTLKEVETALAAIRTL